VILVFIRDSALINRKAPLITVFRYRDTALGLTRLTP
jgi:hypothetical protein